MKDVTDTADVTDAVTLCDLLSGSYPHIIILIIVLLAAGVFGGYINSFLQYDNDFYSSTNNQDKTSFFYSPHKCIFLGVAASFLVPLFLETISSNLIAQAQKDLFKYFQIGGFALIAAITSRSFIKGLMDNLALKQSLNTANKVNEVAANLKKTQTDFKKEINVSERRTSMLIEPISIFDKGDLGGALTKLNELIDAYDILRDYDEAWEWKGYFLKRLERYSDAAKALDKAISLSDKTSWSMFYNAACYKALAKYDLSDTLADLRKALDLNKEKTLRALQKEEDLCLINKTAEYKQLMSEYQGDLGEPKEEL